VRLSGFRHKGLSRLYQEDDARMLSASHVDKLRKILFAMDAARNLEQLRRFPGWRLHALKGGMAGYWSLTVSGNWRLVFRYDESVNAASEIDLIDYH
jgi:proteic killer suppression protein